MSLSLVITSRQIWNRVRNIAVLICYTHGRHDIKYKVVPFNNVSLRYEYNKLDKKLFLSLFKVKKGGL